MTDILIVGDTQRSAELRHEIPVDIVDTFLYAEVRGRRVAIVWSIEGDRIAAVDPSIEIVHSETFPTDDLVLENIIMFYEEVRGPLESYGILSAAENAEQQRLLRALPLKNREAFFVRARLRSQQAVESCDPLPR